MTITDTQAASFGLLAMCAEDTYEAAVWTAQSAGRSANIQLTLRTSLCSIWNAGYRR